MAHDRAEEADTRLPDEVWKPLSEPGLRGRYEVSNRGYIRNRETGKILVSQSSGTGSYVSMQVVLRESAGVRWVSIHKTVATAFLGPCPEGFRIAFRDQNRRHCAASNLYYAPTAGTKKRAVPDRVAMAFDGIRDMPDRILASQFADMNLRYSLTPEQQLVLALLECTMADIQRNCQALKKKSRHPKRKEWKQLAKDWRWITETETESKALFPFEACCQFVGFHPEQTRKRFLNLFSKGGYVHGEQRPSRVSVSIGEGLAEPGAVAA